MHGSLLRRYSELKVPGIPTIARPKIRALSLRKAEGSSKTFLDTSTGAEVVIDDAGNHQVGVQSRDDERQYAGNDCDCPAVDKVSHLWAR